MSWVSAESSCEEWEGQDRTRCVTIALFDFDKTLISQNSGSLWVRSELGLGYISHWQALRAAVWLARYHLGGTDVEPIYREAIESIAGTSSQSIRRRTEVFYTTEVRFLYRPGARAAVMRHRAAGDRLVLLTSSSNYLSPLVCDDLGFDDFLCTHFETDADDRHTGQPEEPICFGDGKRARTARFLEQIDATWADCAFYTDSAADLCVLERVGRPVAVNPDPRLRRVARARKWEIVDWGDGPDPRVSPWPRQAADTRRPRK